MECLVQQPRTSVYKPDIRVCVRFADTSSGFCIVYTDAAACKTPEGACIASELHSLVDYTDRATAQKLVCIPYSQVCLVFAYLEMKFFLD